MLGLWPFLYYLNTYIFFRILPDKNLIALEPILFVIAQGVFFNDSTINRLQNNGLILV